MDCSSGCGNDVEVNAIFWFRRCLRLHDNPALKDCLKGASTIRCVYFLDPWYACPQSSSNDGINKWRFLLECLEDLEKSLRKINLRLFVIRGQPTQVFPKLFKRWDINRLGFEYDPEPYARKRDETIKRSAMKQHVNVLNRISHTLYDPAEIIDHNNGHVPLTYTEFHSLLSTMAPPKQPLPSITFAHTSNCKSPVEKKEEEIYRILTLEELGFDSTHMKSSVWKGGESEALRRINLHLDKKALLSKSDRKHNTLKSLHPTEYILGPYLRFGCLSSRLLYHRLRDLAAKLNKENCPSVTLYGQLLWREYIYTISSKNEAFDKAKGNPFCMDIPWTHNSENLRLFEKGQTGYPWIDAIIVQLRQEAWIHPIARHCIACFLTWGDLWISWENGCKIFENFLLDGDWSLSAGFWMWTSSAQFFKQFAETFCPIEFGKRIYPDGGFVRRYLPALRSMPNEFVYEPWKAPLSLQKQIGCVIGVDYPRPILDHHEANKVNLSRMKLLCKNFIKFVPPKKTANGTTFTANHDVTPTSSSEIIAVPTTIEKTPQSDQVTSSGNSKKMRFSEIVSPAPEFHAIIGNNSESNMHDITNTFTDINRLPTMHVAVQGTTPHYTSANSCEQVAVVTSLTKRQEDRLPLFGSTFMHPCLNQQSPGQLSTNLDIHALPLKQQAVFKPQSNFFPTMIQVVPPFNKIPFCTPVPGACSVFSHANSLALNQAKFVIAHQEIQTPMNAKNYQHHQRV